jgi:hypothetical protein
MFGSDDASTLFADADGRRRDAGAVADWDSLPEPLQLMLADAALRRAAAIIAGQSETLACEMEAGGLQDRGGPEALRLLAALVRIAAEGDPA